MNVLKLTILFLASTPGLLVAQENGFTINGIAPKQFDGKKIYLDYQKDGFMLVDSSSITNGKFSFHGDVEEPIYVRMVFDPESKGKHMVQDVGDRLYLYLGNEDYKFVIRDSLRTAYISGSPLHEEYTAYLKEIGGGFMDVIDDANKEFSLVDKDAVDANEQYTAIRKKYDARFEERRAKEFAFAQNNPNSIFSIDALIDVANRRKLSEIEPVFLKLSKEVRQLSVARGLEARIWADKSIKVGNSVPDFEQPDVDGNPIKVSDFKGRYVLIDFWASWCGPCRAENPNLLAAYNEYKDKGLNILAVSIDDIRSRSAWLKAIDEDEMPWVHVADLKGWNNEAAILFGVRAVPQNYLVDPDGKIIAINLKGENLHKELAKVFGKI